MSTPEFVRRLRLICDIWDEENNGMVPVEVIRSVTNRYDEIKELNNIYYAGASDE